MANEFKVKNGLIVVGSTQVRGSLQLYDADSSNYVAFQAPTTVSPNVTFTLPATDGTNGQVLTTNGSGVLSFTTVSGSGALIVDDLADVDLVAIQTGDVLVYDTSTSTWSNTPDIYAAVLAYLTNVAPSLDRQTSLPLVPISVGTTAPTTPNTGDLWVDTN